MENPPVESSGSRSVKRLVFTNDTKLQDGPGKYQQLFKLSGRRRHQFDADAISRRLHQQLEVEGRRYDALGDWYLEPAEEPQLLNYMKAANQPPTTLREVQLEIIAAKFANQYGFKRAWYVEDLRRLDFVVLSLIYCNPKHAVLGGKDDFGPAVITDNRLPGERLAGRMTALERDAMRQGSIAEKTPVLRTMLICHPSLYGHYAASLAEAGVEYNPPTPTPEQQKMAAQALRVYSAIFNTIAVQRHRYLVAKDGEPSASFTNEDITAFDLRNLLAQFPAQDVGRLRGWMINASDVIYGEEETLAELATLKLEDCPSTTMIAPTRAAAARAQYEHDCPFALAAMEKREPNQNCPYPFCAMKLPMDPTGSLPAPHGGLEKRTLLYYALADAKIDGRATAGPFDLRLDGSRLVLFYHHANQWPAVQDALKMSDYFVTIMKTRVVGIYTTGWTLAAYRRAKFKDVQPPKEAFTMLVITNMAGIALAIQVNSGGLGETIRGVQIPPIVVKLLEDDTVRKYQFSITRQRRCLAAVGIQAKNLCEATNRAAFAFPQPREDLLNVRTGSIFVATQLGLPLVFEPVRPERKNDKKNARVLQEALGDELFKEHQGRMLLNIAHVDYSKNWEDWNKMAVLYLFYESTVPLIFVTREAVAIMESLNYPDRADAMRQILFLLDQVQDVPQLSSIPARAEKDVRPFGNKEYMEMANVKPGPAFMYFTSGSLTVNDDATVLSKMAAPAMNRPVDLASCTPALVADLTEIANCSDLAELSLNQAIDELFDHGAAFPHRCLKCATTNHCATQEEAQIWEVPAAAAATISVTTKVDEEPSLRQVHVAKRLPMPKIDCRKKKVRCVYPPCGSNQHILAVCALMMERCARCKFYGHHAHHHLTVPFLRLIEDFFACVPFHTFAITLIQNIAWKKRIAEDGNLEVAVEVADELMEVMPPEGFPLSFLRPQAP